LIFFTVKFKWQIDRILLWMSRRNRFKIFAFFRPAFSIIVVSYDGVIFVTSFPVLFKVSRRFLRVIFSTSRFFPLFVRSYRRWIYLIPQRRTSARNLFSQPYNFVAYLSRWFVKIMVFISHSLLVMPLRHRKTGLYSSRTKIWFLSYFLFIRIITRFPSYNIVRTRVRCMGFFPSTCVWVCVCVCVYMCMCIQHNRGICFLFNSAR